MRTRVLLPAIALLSLAVSCGKDGNDQDEISEFVLETSEDTISNTSFDRIITVTWDGSSATVSGNTEGMTVKVSGADVTIDNTGTGNKVSYILTGTSTDGSFKVYSNNKQAFDMQDLTLCNKDGAAINNQGKKRCFVVVEGTNVLTDGGSYSGTGSEDLKAAFFSEGQMIFSGDGTLTVNATGSSAIASDDYLRFMGNMTVNASSTTGHALRGSDAVVMTSGTVNASASAAAKKGISSDGTVRFDGGTTTVSVTGGSAYDSDDKEYKSSAGVKADGYFIMNAGTLTVSNSGSGGKGISCDGKGTFAGGTINLTVTGTRYGSSGSGGPGKKATSATDSSKSPKGIKCDGDAVFSGSVINASSTYHEAIESKGKINITGGTVCGVSSSDDGINASGDFTISGGYVAGISGSNDGLDANGNLYIKGGTLFAKGGGNGGEVAIDANTEGGKKLYFQGGNLVVFGGLEQGASLSQTCYTAGYTRSSTYALCSGGSPVLVFNTPESASSTLVVSTSGTTSLLYAPTVSGGTTIFDGWARSGASVSGGSTVTLSSYSASGGSMGPGGGPGGW